MLFAFQSLPVC